MPGIDLTTALARLLSDARLRREYTLDATALARRLDVDENHLEGFLGLDRHGLEIQAEALIAKRYHEVATMLPETIARQGEAAREKFFEYAQSTWPAGHRRHLERVPQHGAAGVRRGPGSGNTQEYDERVCPEKNGCRFY